MAFSNSLGQTAHPTKLRDAFQLGVLLEQAHISYRSWFLSFTGLSVALAAGAAQPIKPQGWAGQAL